MSRFCDYKYIGRYEKQSFREMKGAGEVLLLKRSANRAISVINLHARYLD